MLEGYSNPAFTRDRRSTEINKARRVTPIMAQLHFHERPFDIACKGRGVEKRRLLAGRLELVLDGAEQCAISCEPRGARLIVGEIVDNEFRQAAGAQEAGRDPTGKGPARARQDRHTLPK